MIRRQSDAPRGAYDLGFRAGRTDRASLRYFFFALGAMVGLVVGFGIAILGRLP